MLDERIFKPNSRNDFLELGLTLPGQLEPQPVFIKQYVACMNKQIFSAVEKRLRNARYVKTPHQFDKVLMHANASFIGLSQEDLAEVPAIQWPKYDFYIKQYAGPTGGVMHELRVVLIDRWGEPMQCMTVSEDSQDGAKRLKLEHADFNVDEFSMLTSQAVGDAAYIMVPRIAMDANQADPEGYPYSLLLFPQISVDGILHKGKIIRDRMRQVRRQQRENLVES